jgi:hypothetical protein
VERLVLQYARVTWHKSLKSTRKWWESVTRFISFKVGEGSIECWHDPWCDGLPLKEMFLEL